MLIFLYGPDDYRRRQKENLILSEFQKEHSRLGIERFDFLNEGDLLKFQSFIRNRSIFDLYKLTVLENLFVVPLLRSKPRLNNEQAAEIKQRDLVSELKYLLKKRETTVIISEKKTPPREYNFLLKNPCLVQKFDYLSGYQWQMFIRNEAKRQGIKLADSAIDFLAEIYQGDTWRLVTELKKITFKKNIKAYKKLIEAGKIEEARNKLVLVYKSLDKAAKANVIKENKASRLKSRLTQLINKSTRTSS